MATGDCKVCKWETKNARTIDTSMSKVAWAAETGVSEAGVRRHFKHPAAPAAKAAAPVDKKAATGDSFLNDKGNITMTKTADRVIPLSEWHEDLRKDGFDPADFNSSIGHSVWGQRSTEEGLVTLYANRFNAVQKTKKEKAEEFDSGAMLTSVLESVRSFTYVPAPVAFNTESAVIMPADLQIGKVDWNGGTKETTEQALHSFHEFAAFVREFRPQEICMVDAGDPIENIYNTGSQLGTNDLDLPHQIEAASHVFLEGIKILSPLAPKMRYAAVTSNHGAHRLGPKTSAGDAHSDYGIVIAKMIRNALTLNEAAFGHVTVQVPEPFMESLYFQTSGSDIGVVHSHQAGNVDKIGTWWAGQTHGNLPIAKARILLAGHWHSLRVQQSGDGRWIMVGPASDRGSTWYTNLRGEQSQSGMLTFTTSDNAWTNLKIL